MFECIKQCFSSGFWTSETDLQALAYAQMAPPANEEDNRVYNPNNVGVDPNPKLSAVEAILRRIGWSREQRYRFNPIRSFIQTRVFKAVQTAFAARQLDAVRKLAQDGNRISYRVISENEEYKKYFAPSELGIIYRVVNFVPQMIAQVAIANSIQEKGTAYSTLISVIKKKEKPAIDQYEQAKRDLKRKYQFDQLGIDIDKEIFHAIYPDQFWHAINSEALLGAIDRDVCLARLNQLFGEDLLFAKDFIKRSLSDRALPLTDDQIQRLLDAFRVENLPLSENEIKGRAAIAFLKHLRWPIVRDLQKSFTHFSQFFYLLKNDSRLDRVPRTLEAYTQFLQQNYPNLWTDFTVDGFGPMQSEKKREALLGQLEDLIRTTDRPLWDILLESISSNKKGEVRVEVEFLSIFDEIRNAPDGPAFRLNEPEVRIAYLQQHCPNFYAYLQQKGPFAAADLDAALMGGPISPKTKSDVENLKRASLLFFKKIHGFAKYLTPVFKLFTDEEKQQLLEQNPSEDIKKKKLRFASEFGEISSTLGDCLQNPNLRFVVSPIERQIIEQADGITKESSRYYRSRLARIIQNPQIQRNSVVSGVEDGVSELTEDRTMTRQMSKELPRFYKTTLVRKEGMFWSKEVVSEHKGSDNSEQQQAFLQALNALSKRLKNSNERDLYMLQEMATQTTQTHITLVLGKKLMEENLIFKQSKLTPIVIDQKMREIDSTHIQLTQRYQYREVDLFNMDDEGVPEQDLHSFDVVYTLVKEGNQSRVELTDWTYHPPVLEIEAGAQRLEASEQEIGAALRAPGAAPKKGPYVTIPDQIWGGVKWMATPLTASAGLLWNKGTNFILDRLPTFVPTP